MVITRKALASERAMSRLRASQGDLPGGVLHAKQAVSFAGRLLAAEPANAEWRHWASRAQLDLAELRLQDGTTGEAARMAIPACGPSTVTGALGASLTVEQRNLAGRCLILRARLAAKDGANDAAIALARQALELLASHAPGDRNGAFAFAWTKVVTGDILAGAGDQAGAQATWSAALASWPRVNTETPLQAARRYVLLSRLGRTQEARRIRAQLDTIGYRNPEFATT
jgi:hypothetical protein